MTQKIRNQQSHATHIASAAKQCLREADSTRGETTREQVVT